MKHINDPLPLPRKIDPTIPESFERVVLKALAKRPEDRFQSANEMSEKLLAAAKETGVQVPETISLPVLPSSPASPKTGPVAVFSGTARQQIPDAGFASGDTDITFGKKSTTAVTRITDQVRNFYAVPPRFDQVKVTRVTTAALASVGGIVFVNMALLWLSGIFGWKVFGHAWPLEIVAVGVLLSALMAALAIPWMLIPAGIVMANGFLFSYFALTGWWNHWTFLWPLEPLLVGLSIVAPFLLERQGKRGSWLARRIGVTLIALAVLDFFCVVIAGIILP